MIDVDDVCFRFISIDPGSQLCGITLWEYNAETNELRIVDSWTLDLTSHEKTTLRYLDAMERRLVGLKHNLRRVFRRFPPNAVVTESNFLQKKRVSGYRGLLLTQAAIRDALNCECPHLELDIMHVMRAKEFMQAKSNSKEDVHKMVGVIKDVIYPENFDVDAIGPDARDSIAIGYCYIKQHWHLITRFHSYFPNNSEN